MPEPRTRTSGCCARMVRRSCGGSSCIGPVVCPPRNSGSPPRTPSRGEPGRWQQFQGYGSPVISDLLPSHEPRRRPGWEASRAPEGNMAKGGASLRDAPQAIPPLPPPNTRAAATTQRLPPGLTVRSRRHACAAVWCSDPGLLDHRDSLRARLPVGLQAHKVQPTRQAIGSQGEVLRLPRRWGAAIERGHLLT